MALTVRTQFGAGRSSGSQHSQSLEALLAHIPGLTVVMPSTPADTYGLLRAAIQDPNPVVFIENRLLYGMKGPQPPADHLVPIGRAAVVRPGTDVTVVSVSRMVHEALAAAEARRRRGHLGRGHRPAHRRAARHHDSNTCRPLPYLVRLVLLPGAHLQVGRRLGDVQPGSEERVLGQVVGVLGGPHQAVHVVVDRRLVLAEEPLEGGLVARLREGDGGGLVEGGGTRRRAGAGGRSGAGGGSLGPSLRAAPGAWSCARRPLPASTD